MVELGPHLATERARVETPHLPVRAPGIYPDSCTLGSVRGEAAGRLTIGRADLLYSEASTFQKPGLELLSARASSS